MCIAITEGVLLFFAFLDSNSSVINQINCVRETELHSKLPAGVKLKGTTRLLRFVMAGVVEGAFACFHT